MARITVEDCLNHVDNRFDLVLLATRRARQLSNGVEPLLPWQNDKASVLALREIAEGLITDEALREEEAQAEESITDELAAALAGELAAADLSGGTEE